MNGGPWQKHSSAHCPPGLGGCWSRTLLSHKWTSWDCPHLCSVPSAAFQPMIELHSLFARPHAQGDWPRHRCLVFCPLMDWLRPTSAWWAQRQPVLSRCTSHEHLKLLPKVELRLGQGLDHFESGDLVLVESGELGHNSQYLHVLCQTRLRGCHFGLPSLQQGSWLALWSRWACSPFTLSPVFEWRNIGPWAVSMVGFWGTSARNESIRIDSSRSESSKVVEASLNCFIL